VRKRHVAGKHLAVPSGPRQTIGWLLGSLTPGECCTQLYDACKAGDTRAVRALLADERVDVNQASKVRVGGEGEGGWGEGGGCGAECSARQG
jgi:hypothetical protein